MTQKTISPVDGSVYVERDYASEQEINKALENAKNAQKDWRKLPLDEKAKLSKKAIEHLIANAQDIGEELSWQMGRPIKYTPGEITGGTAERAEYMINIAKSALADIEIEPKEGFTRFIKREPLGTVLVLAPWNYPFLTSVNAIIPALMAGNTVILKHSSQTPLVAERYAQAFEAAGLPKGVFQFVHATHADVAKMVADKRTDYVAFTGSVPGGYAVQEAASKRFIGAGLELGGKDPGYVRSDANIEYAVENLVDGSFFNSGQSCCGIERIYVHESKFDEFVEAFREMVYGYKLGNPLDPETSIGPMVKTSAADFVRAQIDEAVKKGAVALIDPNEFKNNKPGSPYMAPQVLINVNHKMRIMNEESFGPVVGIMPVKDDEQAIKLMNDSDYGLTASVWTNSVDSAIKIADELETGTAYMNRCDYLDPALAWTGVKDSGRGCTLSAIGYEHLTRPKSFHLKTKI